MDFQQMFGCARKPVIYRNKNRKSFASYFKAMVCFCNSKFKCKPPRGTLFLWITSMQLVRWHNLEWNKQNIAMYVKAQPIHNTYCCEIFVMRIRETQWWQVVLVYCRGMPITRNSKLIPGFCIDPAVFWDTRQMSMHTRICAYYSTITWQMSIPFSPLLYFQHDGNITILIGGWNGCTRLEPAKTLRRN